MTRFVKHETGSVQSVTDEMFEENLMIGADGLKGVSVPGPKVLDPRYVELTEDQARQANPQLFGVVDPKVAEVTF